MQIYEVTFRVSPNTKGDMDAICKVIGGAFGYIKFGTSQMREHLPGKGMRLRITAEQFVKFFILRRQYSVYSYLKWEDVKEIKVANKKTDFFYADCTDGIA